MLIKLRRAFVYVSRMLCTWGCGDKALNLLFYCLIFKLVMYVCLTGLLFDMFQVWLRFDFNYNISGRRCQIPVVIKEL